MNLIKRLKRLWQISSVDIPVNGIIYKNTSEDKIVIIDRQAQIIKRNNDPVENFIKKVMNNEQPIPYSDYIYIQPVKESSIFASQEGALYTFGEVLAVGDETKRTKVGDYIAFELWDKPEFLKLNGEVCHFVREKDVICQIPKTWAQTDIKNDIQE